MIELATVWGTLKFASYDDAATARRILELEFDKIGAEARWREFTARVDFTAVCDSLSMSAVDAHPIVHLAGEVVFWADLDQRERDNEWQFREFCYYKIRGKKYQVDAADFAFGFDMNAVDWAGDEQERGGEFMEVNARVDVYIICTNQQLATRAI